MAYTYDELKHKAVDELREIAASRGEHKALQGYAVEQGVFDRRALQGPRH